MAHYRSIIGASLLALFATAPAFAQQGAPGGSLYKDPQSRSFVQSTDKAPADSAKAPGASAPAPTGAASGEVAAPPTDGSLMGPRFGGG